MRTFPDARIRVLVMEARRAADLIAQGEHAEAQQVLVELRARASKAGITSSYVDWALATCQEAVGDLEAAFASICHAARLDPFAPTVQQAFDSIAWKLRTALADPTRPADDPSSPRIYAALMAAGECDVSAHVAMARHLSAAGKHEKALRILDATTLLASVSRDAWLAKAAVARALGQEALAQESEAEAAAIPQRDIPFNMTQAAGAC